MLLDELKEFNIILASQSPRRHHLLEQAGIKFSVTSPHSHDESFPEGLDKFEIPVYLAELKSREFIPSLKKKDILITADTIVWFESKVINKPADRNEAIAFLKRLSGKMHEVVTGVCLTGMNRKMSFFAHSEVHFGNISEEEIVHYIDNYKPFDKAGAYGIQEWIGYVGIKMIRGSFFNVMGLPIQQVYQKLGEFIKIP
jgi:septum formation protein